MVPPTIPSLGELHESHVIEQYARSPRDAPGMLRIGDEKVDAYVIRSPAARRRASDIGADRQT